MPDRYGLTAACAEILQARKILEQECKQLHERFSEVMNAAQFGQPVSRALDFGMSTPGEDATVCGFIGACAGMFGCLCNSK